MGYVFSQWRLEGALRSELSGLSMLPIWQMGSQWELRIFRGSGITIHSENSWSSARHVIRSDNAPQLHSQVQVPFLVDLKIYKQDPYKTLSSGKMQDTPIWTGKSCPPPCTSLNFGPAAF